MNIQEKRRILSEYCQSTKCKECKLNEKDWKSVNKNIIGKKCFNVLKASDQELDEALKLIDYKESNKNEQYKSCNFYNQDGTIYTCAKCADDTCPKYGFTLKLMQNVPPKKLLEDPVNNPSHYKQGDIECIDAIKASMTHAEYAGFLKGQVIKYLWRYQHKGKPVEDLKKAQWYQDRLIKLEEAK